MMIQTIKIRNFALIETAEIPFERGLNILSGETGAGKSIVLEAISLLLGGRANSETVRTGAEEAVVEGFFDIEELPWLRQRLAEVGIESEGHELLIKRTVARNGKNRIFINGQLATLGMLSTVCEDLIDLCGQHEHQSLFKSHVQVELLDRFAGLEELQRRTAGQFQKARSLIEEWESLKKKEEERIQRLAFLQFQLEELDGAALRPGEDDRLASEKRLLQSVEQRMSLASQVHVALDGEEGALNALRLALSKVKALEQMDEGVGELQGAIERALAEVEDAAGASRAYVSKAETSPDRLAEVQERLSLIINLKRKYGTSLDEIIAHHSKLREEIDLLTHLSSRLDSLETELQQEQKVALQLGRELFTKRKTGADKLSKAVSKELKELRMQDAEVGFSLGFSEQVSDWSPESLGTEAELLVRTNLGEEEKPIQKIVSGGELSRLMLAIRRVIADKGGIGVYLFDEIDAGLGGQTAFTVGKKLKSVASYNQVLCITHVPQVACFADHHLSISKHTQKGRTVTEVRTLEDSERKDEIARMLGSEKLTPAALKNAKDLIESARA
jgi:DNA repair protein RecN (Recombination protein N)